MNHLKWLAAVAAFFIVSAHAQNSGTVTNHATAIGKGAGIQGFTSVGPCGAGIAEVGNASADPSCQTLPVAGGGTGITTMAIGDLLQASSSTALARLAAVATGNVLLSGGVGVVSSWGKVGLTTHVSGVLPLANGGNGADLSATGGTSQFLRQNTVGGAVTPVRPACADLSNSNVFCSAAVGQMPATATNDNAAGGFVGEYAESIIVVGIAVALTTATDKTVTSLSLTAGDWDVDCTINFRSAASTSVTVLNASLSLVTNVSDATAGRFTAMRMAAVVPGAADLSLNVVPYRFSLSGTTSIFMVATSVFTVSTESAWGIIRARRVR